MHGSLSLFEALYSDPARLKEFLFAFQRDAFGIVKFPTDGRRLLAYTNSGVDKLKEAYAFSKDGSKIRAEKVTQV